MGILQAVFEVRSMPMTFSYSPVCKNTECLIYLRFTREKYSIFHPSQLEGGVGNALERSWKLQIDQPYKLFEIRINDSVWKQLEKHIKSKNFNLASVTEVNVLGFLG